MSVLLWLMFGGAIGLAIAFAYAAHAISPRVFWWSVAVLIVGMVAWWML